MNYIAEPTTQRLPEADRLRALQAFNARLVCMTVDDSSYQEVVNGVWKVIGSDTCALFLKDPDSETLRLMACEGYEKIAPGHLIPLNDNDSTHVQAFSEEYMVNLQNLNDQYGVRPLSDKLRSNLVMPIISNSGPVGVFDFGSYEAGWFDAADLAMCSMLVDQMAFSLENIRLVNELSSSRDAVIRGMALLAEVRDTHISG
ncbi:MAG: GAF domain-containing protein, partial [Candidatus Krumholzibacteriia bacterium]